MAVPTLALEKKDFYSKVGASLGWGRGSDAQTGGGDTAYTADQLAKLKDFVDSGYARLLTTPPIEGFHPGAYDWSWLKPVWTGALESGKRTVLLPEDFAGFEGDVTVERSGGTYWPIDLFNENVIRTQYAIYPDSTGEPQCCGVQWLKGADGGAQRAQLYVYPQANAAYTLKAAYHLVPGALSDSSPYAYGGVVCREALLESCLAVAEERFDGERGVHYLAFIDHLTAAIRKDRHAKAQMFGYVGDSSDNRWVARDRHWMDSNYTVTIGGANPG